MIKESYSEEEKIEIAKNIKDISLQTIDKEYEKLKSMIGDIQNISERSKVGNNIVDYFTFRYRLETKGKYDCNFFDFLENIEEFKKKKFIQNMFEYYVTVKNKNNKKNKYIVMKEVYNICISAINIIRPIVYMQIYDKYKPKKVLDFCAGWGGAAVASNIMGIEKYIGIDINSNLAGPYEDLIKYLGEKNSDTKIEMYFKDALTFDYGAIDYDLVFTSPPYYFIQKYQKNENYNNSKREMDEKFYTPIFTKVYDGLKPGGYFIINVCKEVYNNVLFKIFGEPHEIFNYGKSQRQNDYKEMIYCWKKS